MAAITAALVAIAAVIVGWITIEIACKPCLETGREAIDRALDPNYDPDDSAAPPQPPAEHQKPLLGNEAQSSAAPKSVD